MALALRGTPQSGAITNGIDVTLTFDVAPEEDDVVFFYGGRGNSADAQVWGPSTAGYNEIETLDSATGPKFGLWYKVMGATPDADVVGQGGGSLNHGVAYGCYVIDGSTIDAAIFDATATTTGEVTAVPDGPAITTQTPGAWVITHAANGSADNTRGTVANYTPLAGHQANDVDDITIEAVYREVASPGVEDPPAWSLWSSAVGAAFTIALKPATATSAAVTGTATAAITESDVVAGAKTVIVTLTGDTWVAAGATFDAQRQAIIDGLDSAQAEATGWNAEVRDNLAVTTVARTSDTVATITLSAQAAYNITAQETVTVTVPGSALTGGSPLTATPTFTVDFDDVTAPVLSAQTVDSVTGEGGVPKVTTDEGNGTAYVVIVPNGDIPSVTQIKAGQQSSGAAALAASNQAVVGTGVQTFAEVTGLSPVTAHDVWFLHTDAALNDSTAVKADFTTNTAAVPRTWICQMMARQLVEQEWEGQQHGLEPGLGTPVARTGRRRPAGLLIMEE